jgi:hypothetical protein
MILAKFRHAPPLGRHCWVLAVVLALDTGPKVMCNDVVWMDSKRIDSLANDIGFRHSDVRVWRSAAGTKLYIGAYTYTNNQTVVEILSDAGSETKRVRGGAPVLAADDSLICSITNHTLVFAGGRTISFAAPSGFDFSPGGGFFFYFSDIASGAAVFRSSDPQRPLFEVPRGFMPQNIFVATNTVFLFGKKFKPGSAKTAASGLVFSLDGKAARLKREIDLSRFGGVLDMDPSTGLLLVEGKGDLVRRWGLLNPETGEYKSRGRSQGAAFFLDEALVKRLERRWK